MYNLYVYIQISDILQIESCSALSSIALELLVSPCMDCQQVLL